jgi:hypothetical protein
LIDCFFCEVGEGEGIRRGGVRTVGLSKAVKCPAMRSWGRGARFAPRLSTSGGLAHFLSFAHAEPPARRVCVVEWVALVDRAPRAEEGEARHWAIPGAQIGRALAFRNPGPQWVCDLNSSLSLFSFPTYFISRGSSPLCGLAPAASRSQVFFRCHAGRGTYFRAWVASSQRMTTAVRRAGQQPLHLQRRAGESADDTTTSNDATPSHVW